MEKESRRVFIQKMGFGMSAVGLAPKFTKPMEFDKKLRVALVGLGRYANYLAEGIAVSNYCKLTGIVTGTPSKATEWAQKYNIPKQNIYNYETFDTISQNPDIDVIYIVLPNGMHKEYVLRAAKAKKHVIVEKPMATNAADAMQMINACKAAHVQLAVGYRLHFEPYNLEMKRLGQEQVFGQVRHIQASLGYRFTPDLNDWHLNKKLSGGGCLQNLGVYCIQAARYITGLEPVAVTAQFGPTEHKEAYKDVEESIHWQMEFANGAIATCSSGNNFSIDRLYAAADNGTFELSPAISYGPFVGKSSLGPMNFPEINQQQTQMDELAKYLLAERPFPDHISGLEGYKDMKIIDAVYKAAQTGQKVKI